MTMSGRYTSMMRVSPAPAVGETPRGANRVPATATPSNEHTSTAVCQAGARRSRRDLGSFRGRASGKLLAWRESMISEVITPALPVLAAGWSFLYLLLGGGVGGAFLLFVVLKMFGK